MEKENQYIVGKWAKRKAARSKQSQHDFHVVLLHIVKRSGIQLAA